MLDQIFEQLGITLGPFLGMTIKALPRIVHNGQTVPHCINEAQIAFPIVQRINLEGMARINHGRGSTQWGGFVEMPLYH
jgi:hypothetical protein